MVKIATGSKSLTQHKKIHGINISPMRAGGEKGKKISPDKYKSLRYYVHGLQLHVHVHV